MAQTKEGALIVSAQKRGMSVEEFVVKSETHKWCHVGKHWQVKGLFITDNSRHDKLGTKCKECTKSKDPYASLRGRVSTFKGRKHSPESLKKLSVSLTGRVSPYRGVPRSAEVRAKISQSHRTSDKVPRGDAHYAYKDGQSKRRLETRRSAEYLDWRKAVYERDQYKCQRCGDNKGGNLNAHHIKPFADFPELRLDVSNGITLCEPCHEAEHYKADSTRNLRKRKKQAIG